MKKQITKRWQSSLLPIIAIILAFGAFSGAAVAQEKSIGARYGSREPRTCEDTKAPARGAITAALALKYINCQKELISIRDLYLVENVKVQVGGGIPYAALIGRSFPEIDVNHPVYPIRGSLTKYQCVEENAQFTDRLPGANCTRYEEPNATGYCYKTTFGDWKCNMTDWAGKNKENITYNVAPPKGANNGAADKTMPNDKSADTTPKQPAKPKDTKQTAGTKDEPETAERNEDGFPKPDFSEMEKYVEIIKYDYSPLTGRVDMVVKAKKEINIYRWYLTAYDADGVKINEDALNGGPIPLPIGEPTRIYGYAPNERDIKRVARIAIVRKLD